MSAVQKIGVVLFLVLSSCNKFSSNDATTTQDPSSGITSSTNQTVGAYPHKIDFYIPSGATSAIVFLHGGGGKKEGIEYSLGFKTTNTTSSYVLTTSAQTWLTNNHVMAVFPQGQNVTGNNWTWSNYVMISGVDDVAFLQALVTSIKTTYPSIAKVYLAGHSNGGMMANRMWCESPTTFDGYAALAGPPSVHLDASSDHPCAPSAVKPFISIVGDRDRVLTTTNNMAATTWTINSNLVTEPSAWYDASPAVLNDKLYYSVRTNLKCAATPAAPTVSGQVTTYSDCSGSLKLMIIASTGTALNPTGGDHCLGSASDVSLPCFTNLVGDTGLDLKTEVFNFLKNF